MSFKLGGCYRHFLITFLTSYLVCFSFPEITQAQASPPITPSGLDTQVSDPLSLPNGKVQHNIIGGTRPSTSEGEPGPNLFHSFGDFGVPASNIANFQNDSTFITSNILSRVTGGNPSIILGIIQTEGFEGANLYLMNPNGIVFGDNASLNVGGAAHFTTADYIKLNDNIQFTALPSSQDALLSIAPVSSFGFLSTNPNSVSIEGGSLSVKPGQSISLISGDINIGSGLRAPGGKISLVSVDSSGEVLAETPDLASNINDQSFDTLGTIQVSGQSVIDTSGDGGGSVVIRGGRLVLDNSIISANTTGPAMSLMEDNPGAGIDIEMSQDIVIQNEGLIETNISKNVGPGIRSGGVQVKADRLTMFGSQDFANFPFTGIRSIIEQGSMGDGSRDITVETNSIRIVDFGGDTTGFETRTMSTGNAPNIILRTTGDIDLDNGRIFTNSRGAGNSGNIELTSTHGDILIRDTSKSFGPNVTSQTPSSSSGLVGNIIVNAPQGDILVADSATFFTRINGKVGAVGSGKIQLTAQNLTVTNDSGIQIDNFLSFEPGDITVNISGQLTISGSSSIQSVTRGPVGSGNLSIKASDILVTDSSTLSTETTGAELGGMLNIFAKNIELTNGGKLTSSSRIDPRIPPDRDSPVIPSGAGGTINIQGLATSASSLVIDGADSAILTDTQGTGPAGNINIFTENFNLINGGQLRSSSRINSEVLIDGKPVIPSGAGGTINIQGIATSASSLVIDGADSAILTDTQGTGSAGSIILNVNDLITDNGPEISSNSTRQESDAGGGGTIEIKAIDSIDLTDSNISTSVASGNKSGGNITLKAKQVVTLNDETTLTAESSGFGNAGSIYLKAGDIVQIENSNITTQSAIASGGDISLEAVNLIRLRDSTIESSVQGNQTTSGGDISIDPQFVVLQNSQILATARDGLGGNIQITGGQILQDPFTTIDASSETGISGTVNIRGPIQNLSETIAPLSEEILKVSALFAARCAAQKGGKFSSFLQSGRDETPLGATNFLPSPLTFSTSGPEGTTTTFSPLGFDEIINETEWKFFTTGKTLDLPQGCSSVSVFPS
ncbi:MAG: hypothetical protein NPIRA01_16730 [Nitrospirales bacterium]|nr:MAG: hypothetical protein NPIRA01_16730 [Nitrospirales bacterium]